MVNIENLENSLYRALVGNQSQKYIEVWNIIKKNPTFLNEAIRTKKNKFNEKNTLSGIVICDAVLNDYENIESSIYTKLINEIYNDKDIARIVVRGASNGGFSFLLMSLWNHSLKLSENQKEFAVNEAMNKMGTTRYPNIQTENSDYMFQMFHVLCNTQAHGIGPFDIRYHILKNPNWSNEEKQKLIFDFWQNYKAYENTLEEWEWAIINDEANYKEGLLPGLDKSYLYEYTYENLLEFYSDKKITDRIWEEINFCKLMHQLRPTKRERELKRCNK